MGRIHCRPFAIASITCAAALGGTGALGGAASASTAPPQGDTEGLVIGSVLYGIDFYQTRHGEALEEYGEGLGIEIRNCNSENDLTKQQQCVADLITAGVDGIILQPFEPSAGTTMVEQAQDADIPIITWAIGPVEGVQVPWIELTEFEQAAEAGRTAAQWVLDNFGESPRIVILGVPNNTNCSNREDGFLAGATEVAPDTELVARPNGGGQLQVSADEMATVIDSGAEFNIVTGCNGASTLGALQSLRAAGRGEAVDKVPVSEYLFSVDGSPQEVEALLDPTNPVMQVLSLTPYDNVRVLLDTMVQRINGEIGDDFVGSVQDVLLPADCSAVNEILEVQYGQAVECPEAGVSLDTAAADTDASDSTPEPTET